MLSDSGGQLYGVATEEDFVNIIANTTSSRDRGCFRNGAGIYTYQRITNDKLPHVFLSIIFKIDGYLLNYMFLILGIYFNNINGSNIQFTLRLQHETSYSQHWFTDKVTNDFTIPNTLRTGPKLVPRYSENDKMNNVTSLSLPPSLPPPPPPPLSLSL